MHNLSVKFSALAGKYEELSPQVFLDLMPEESLALYKSLLPKRIRYTLEFGLSDPAILLILDNDFQVNMDTLDLVCTRRQYDKAVWLHAFGLKALPTDAKLTECIEQDFTPLWQGISRYLKATISPEDQQAIAEEFRTLIGLYHLLYQDLFKTRKPQPHTRTLLTLLRFMVVHAIHKTDAAQVLFGAKSEYTRIWLEKQQMLLDCIQLLATQRSRLSA